MISPLSTVSPDSSPRRIGLSPYAETLEVPNLIDIQLESFRWFKDAGLQLLLQEVSPIKDYTGNRLELYLKSYEFKEPKHSLEECRQRAGVDTAHRDPHRHHVFVGDHVLDVDMPH